MENNFTDKHIVDQAWNTMQATLDREMPAEKKRRAMWLLLPAFACLLGIGVWYTSSIIQVTTDPIQNQSAPTIFVNKEIADETIEINSLEPSSQSKNFETIPNVEKSSSSSSQVATTARPSNKAKTITKTKSNSIKTTTAKNRSEKLNNNLVQNITSSPLGNKIRFSKDLTSTNTLKTMEKIKSLKNTPTDQKLEKEINEIEASEVELLLHEDLFLSTLEILPIQHFENKHTFTFTDIDNSKMRKWTLGLESSLLYSLKFNARTILLEGQIARQISKKWSIRSGLGLKFQQYNLYRFETISEDDLFVDFNTQSSSYNSGVASGDLSTPAFSKTRISYEYLYVPLSVGFRLKNRWLAEGGLNFNVINLDRVSATNSEKRESVSLSSSPFVKHFSLSYDLGISYMLNSKFAVGIQGQYNTSRFNVESAKEPGRTQVGLYANYRF